MVKTLKFILKSNFFLILFYALDCEECEQFYYDQCPIHDTMIPVADKMNKGCKSVDYSRATLPDGLEIKKSTIPEAGLGVFTKQSFNIGVRFGPYEGKKVRPDIPRSTVDTSYMWEVFA